MTTQDDISQFSLLNLIETPHGLHNVISIHGCRLVYADVPRTHPSMPHTLGIDPRGQVHQVAIQCHNSGSFQAHSRPTLPTQPTAPFPPTPPSIPPPPPVCSPPVRHHYTKITGQFPAIVLPCHQRLHHPTVCDTTHGHVETGRAFMTHPKSKGLDLPMTIRSSKFTQYKDVEGMDPLQVPLWKILYI